MAPRKGSGFRLSFRNNFDYLRYLGERRRLRYSKKTLRRLRERTSDVRECFSGRSMNAEGYVRAECSASDPKKECDLEQKIDLEIKMCEGTTKLLLACKHPSQALEAAKSLLTSNERMTAYMAELQQRKANERRALKDSTKIHLEPCKAKVSVSDIRMPLIWKDSDHFKNKGDYRRFAVFCLLKIGTEIYDTLMVNNVDHSMTDITFDDVVVFDNVVPDFEFRLEVYSHVIQDDLSIASTLHKIKRKINDSIGRKVGKKLAATLKEELTSDVGPKFDLVAYASLKLSEVHDSIKTHDLVLENLENPHSQLPLFGHFCCRLAAQPECLIEDRVAGHLAVVQQVGELSCLRRLFCTMRNFTLFVWTKPEEVNLGVEPHMAIPVNKMTNVQQHSSLDYPHSFTLQNATNNGRTNDVTLVADDENDLTKWLAHISQHCRDHDLWKQASERIMEIHSPTPCRLQFIIRSRKGSLYDETPLKDSSQAGNMLFGDDSINLSPSMRPRSRSSSSGSSSAPSSVSGRLSAPHFRQRSSNHESCL